MPWVKVDEDFYDHPKFLELSAGAIGLWVIGLAYSNRYLTDGELTKRGLARAYPGADREKHAKALVTAGLWDATDDGWQVHDYLKYQPSKAQVEAQRAERSAAGKKGAASRWGRQQPTPDPPNGDGASHSNSHGETDSNSHGKSDAPSRPVPSRLPTSPLHGSAAWLSTGDETTTTDQGIEATARAACRNLAHVDLARRPPHLEPVGNVAAWLDTATEARLEIDGDRARTLAAAGLGPGDIAAQLAHPANGHASPHLALVPKPVHCDACGLPGHPTDRCTTFPPEEAHP